MIDLSEVSTEQLETELDQRATSRSKTGCGDSACVVARSSGGMTANGGCQCSVSVLRHALQGARIAALAARADVFEECARLADRLAARSFGFQRVEVEQLARDIRALKDGAK